MTHLSIVSPVYRAENCIEELYLRLVASIEPITTDFEMVLVEDGGNDGSWERIAELARLDRRVKGLKLSKNYGQHCAITAGLEHASGDWIIVMDCDLQDRPEEIPRLYTKAQEGFDIVFARRNARKDSLYRRWSSKFFTTFYNYLGDFDLDNSVANFSISSRRVIDCVRRFHERNRSFPIFLNSVGFSRSHIDVQHAPRFAGSTSYTFDKLLNFAIECIISQSNKPLRLSIRFGFALSLLSFFYGMYVLVRAFFFSIVVPGWATVVLLICFLGGLGFANLGILGLYLGKVFDEVKGRPLYCVEEALNMETNTNNEFIH
jgi:polyisoprenyl-phosphate glycosyltransferase